MNDFATRPTPRKASTISDAGLSFPADSSHTTSDCKAPTNPKGDAARLAFRGDKSQMPSTGRGPIGSSCLQMVVKRLGRNGETDFTWRSIPQGGLATLTASDKGLRRSIV